MSIKVEQEILGPDDVWDTIRSNLGKLGYDNFYDWLLDEINTGAVKRFYVYTRKGGKVVYSLPIGSTELDAILVYKPNPNAPGAWAWIIERIVSHRDNKLANLTPVDVAMLRFVGPWVGE
jgi:hypothetical protein